MSALLEVENIRFFYGSRSVLRSAGFSAGAGEFLALLGTNGSGKSTLLDIVAGFRKPHSGSVRIAGQNQRDWTLRQMSQRVSHLPQSVPPDLPFTAEQLVAMGRYPHTDRWLESEEDKRRIGEAMDRTRCRPLQHRPFASLSGGERQRVLLASCLAQDASILLLDEPSTFLDVDQQLHCFSLLRDQAAQGKLCIAVTHDLNLALAHCTRLIVLADGVIAHDLQTDRAQERQEWLAHFSSRLRIGATPAGDPLVWYR